MADCEGMMLRVTIDLIPHGNKDSKEMLAEILIQNDRSGTWEIGNYRVTMSEHGNITGGRVENHPRLQHGPAFLVMKAIEACLKGDKNA